MLLLCIFKQFFVPYVWVDIKQSGGQISNVESTYQARMHNEFGWPPNKGKTVYGQSSKILFKQKWGISKV